MSAIESVVIVGAWLPGSSSAYAFRGERIVGAYLQISPHRLAPYGRAIERRAAVCEIASAAVVPAGT